MAAILIVDGHAPNRAYLTSLLGYNGHRLLEASDGAEALAIALAERPDLIVAGILMPTMDGYGLVRRLRGEPALAETRVLFSAAPYHECEARWLAQSCGVRSFVTKPSEPEADLAAIESALGAPAAPVAPADGPDDAAAVEAAALKAGNHRLAAAMKLSVQLSGELDPQRLIQSFVHGVRQIAGARCAIAGVLHADGSRFQVILTSGLDTTAAASLVAPDPGSAPLHTILKDGLPVRLQNPQGWPALGLSTSHSHVTSFLGAPIASATRIYGFIGLIDKLGGEFTAEDEHLTAVLAAQVGRIYQKGSLYAAALRRSAELEREIAARGETDRALDIAERSRLENQFRRAQQRLREVVVSSPAVLFTLSVVEDRIEGISWVSDNLRAVLGHASDGAIGDAWWLANVHPDDLEHAAEEARRELFGRGQCSREFRFRHGDAVYRWTRSDMRLVRDEAGLAIEVVGAWTDISERKRVEEDRAKLREQLLQAQKLESAGRLADSISHDFNNLLTVINGYSGMLAAELPPSSDLREMAEEIAIAGNRAAELTNQLSLFSRTEAVQPAELNLNHIVAGAEKMLIDAIGENIRLDSELDPQLGSILADAGQMHRLLMNLAENARDAMPNGGKLRIETRNVELKEDYVAQHAEVKAGSYVELKVSDNGAGIDKEALSHWFEPFLTAKAGGERNALVRASIYCTVREAGGSIRIDSEPGKGTSFTIDLPRCQAAAAEGPRANQGVERRGTETVLVVEDQPQLLKIAASILRSQGYRVLTAAGASAALLECERHTGEIHLLLTDVVMPQMTGPELAALLSATRPRMRVVFMSGYGEGSLPDNELCGAFLTKPFSPGALVEKIRETLGPRRVTGTILVVDDESGIRKLLRHLLGGAGYTVLEAEHGKQAVKQVGTAHVDLVITDLAMPEQEGFETITALRAAKPGLKIIAMSGRFAGPLLRAAEYLGAQASIAKPIKSEDLLATVARLLVLRD